MINKQIFNNKALEQFYKLVYGNIIYPFNIKSHETIIKEKKILGWKVSESGKKTPEIEIIEHQGYEVRSSDESDKRTFFLLSEHAKEYPRKIADTKEVVFNRKVYNVIIDSYPALYSSRTDMGMREFIESWLDIEHQSPNDLMLARFIILSNAISQNTTRIVTKKSFGKDGLVNAMIYLTDCGIKINGATSAKLAQALEKPYTFFNEIAGIRKYKDDFEKFFQGTSDGNPVYEHDTTGSDKTKTRYDISKYGYTIGHNLPEYYIEKGKEAFEQIFGEEVFDRIFPVELKGQVEKNNSFTLAQKNWYQFVKDNISSYRYWSGRFFWLKENIDKINLTFDISKYDFTYVKGEVATRFHSSFYNICKVIELYSKEFENSSEKFYYYADLLFKRHKDYIEHIKELGLLPTGDM